MNIRKTLNTLLLLVTAISVSTLIAGEEKPKAGEEVEKREGGQLKKLDLGKVEPPADEITFTILEDKAEEISLRGSKLSDPEHMLSIGDIVVPDKHGPAFPIIIEEGIIIPKNSFIFVRGQENAPEAITIGGESILAKFENSKVTFEMGKKKYKLKRKGAMFKPLSLRMPDKRKYKVEFPFIKEEKDKDLSFKVNLTHYFRCGEALKGKLDGKYIYIYDDNLDGVYGNEGDSYTIDKGKVFAPLKKLVSTQKDIHSLLQISEDMKSASFAPCEAKTGELKVETSLKKTEVEIAFESTNGANTLTIPDGESVTALATEYRLLYGLLYSKRNKQVIAGITPYKMKPIKVKEGENTTLELEPPYKLDFEYDVKATEISIDPEKFRILGASGEMYCGLQIQDKPVASLKGKDFSRFLGKFSKGENGLSKFTFDIPRAKNGDNITGKFNIEIKTRINGFGPVEGAVEITF